jgi:23S rRNA (adenine1618-N6)-methyltransferase
MQKKKKEHPKEKIALHPRNKHRERYDFDTLTKSCPELTAFVKLNEYKDQTIDFFDPAAVKTLNKALLKQFYGINFWDIPENYLCPPIPGRADYVNYLADLLAGETPDRKIPTGSKIHCLDIGVGANCVYPIIGNAEYGWSFTGSDIDPVSIKSARRIAENNSLDQQIRLKLQANPKSIFRGIIEKGEQFDVTISNPPFHSSFADARAGTIRKLSNLKGKEVRDPVLNFGGKSNELWCEGGEERFVTDMIRESKVFASQCLWFSTIISKPSTVQAAYHFLKLAEAAEVKTIPMQQGQKTTRIVAWTFLSKEQRPEWVKKRWS